MSSLVGALFLLFIFVNFSQTSPNNTVNDTQQSEYFNQQVAQENLENGNEDKKSKSILEYQLLLERKNKFNRK